VKQASATSVGSAAAEAKELLKRGHFLSLLLLVCRSLKEIGFYYMSNLWSTARDEHSIVSMMYPKDIEVTGVNLSDMQIAQIFWNTLMLEMVMLSFIFTPPAPGESSGGFSPIAMIIEACIVVGPCVAGAVLFRYMFRWGNRGRRLRPKRERNVVSHGKLARALQLKAEGATAIARGTEQAGIEEEASKDRRSKRMRRVRRTRDAIRYFSGWAMVLFVYLVCILVLLILASQKIGPDSFNTFMLTYGTAVMTAWAIVEPLEICLIVFFPFILDNDYVANIRSYAKDLGLY